MLDNIILHLKANSVTFGGRVAGAAEFGALEENTSIIVPAAFVVPIDDRPEAGIADTGYSQVIRDAFAVIVFLDCTADRRGQNAASKIYALRAELVRALVRWEPDDQHGPVVYDGGEVLSLSRTHLLLRFDFSATTEITQGDTWAGIEITQLPLLEAVRVNIDTIEPFDRNRATTGPDDRLEASSEIITGA